MQLVVKFILARKYMKTLKKAVKDEKIVIMYTITKN